MGHRKNLWADGLRSWGYSAEAPGTVTISVTVREGPAAVVRRAVNVSLGPLELARVIASCVRPDPQSGIKFDLEPALRVAVAVLDEFDAGQRKPCYPGEPVAGDLIRAMVSAMTQAGAGMG